MSMESIVKELESTDHVLLIERKNDNIELVEDIIFRKNNENANQPHNPESINLALAEVLIKEYALSRVFSPEVAEAHRRGDIHIHDLGFANRTYCGGHSLEYIKKYGLDIPNVTSVSKPAKSAEVLIGHMVKMSAVLQSFYAGAVGWDAVNIFFSTHLLGRSDKDIKQIAQMLIFEFNQLAGARGSQVVFSDFNLYYAVPEHFENTPALGYGAKYMGVSEEDYEKYAGDLNSLYADGKIRFFDSVSDITDAGLRVLTYKDFEPLAQRFLYALYEIYREGDANQKPFFFPKPLLHIDEKFFAAEGWKEFLEFVSTVASEKGSPYFIFERNGQKTISQCCRLRMELGSDDLEEAKTPEKLRFTSLQNVTINLPSVAFESGGDESKFYSILTHRMELALRAHREKKAFIDRLLSMPNTSLSLFKLDHDGRPYLRDEKLSFLIGMVGLNEAVKVMTGKELHESNEAYAFGLGVIAHMNRTVQRFSNETGYKVVLEESPAESAAYRLAKLDIARYPGAINYVRINERGVYYTNSVHFAYDADIDWFDRVVKQGKFHNMIEGGAIIHIWLGEHRPNPKAIANFVVSTYKNTEAQQITFSPEFTVCESCHTTSRGLLDSCPHCGSTEVYGVTRIVGYFSRVDWWNPGKKAELKDRLRFNINEDLTE